MELDILDIEAALEREMALLERVKRGEVIQGAALWQAGEQCLVAPRAMAAQLRSGLAGSAQDGWPCIFRPTGGDVTPQGPGVLSLTYCFRQSKSAANPISAAYERVCDKVLAALGSLGISGTTGAVEGSYCDGDFNVVVDGLKFAGTAQRMTPVVGSPDEWAVLGQAMMILQGEETEIIDAINALYAGAGMAKRVRTGVNVTLGDLGIEADAFIEALSSELGLG
ncbi:MAG: hypothetical protein AAGA15_01980 [Pseudomonadota bacterium]